MADRKDLMIPPQGGVIRDFVLRVRLIWRLIRDRRVSFWLKIIPILRVSVTVAATASPRRFVSFMENSSRGSTRLARRDWMRPSLTSFPCAAS